MGTALKGRTHGCSDQRCDLKILLANPEPSTHGPKRTFGKAAPTSAFEGRAEEGQPCRLLTKADISHGVV